MAKATLVAAFASALALGVLPPQGSGTAEGTWRFRKVSIQDRADMIGGEAFTFLAPVGWRVEGGLVWRVHPTMPAALSVRVKNPGGLEQLETFPTAGYTFGGFTGPGTYFPVGSLYLGNEVSPPVADALHHLRARLLPRWRANLRPRIVSQQALPELARAYEQGEPGWRGTGATFSAGKVRIAYQVDGRAVEEDLYAVLATTVLPSSMTAPLVTQVADLMHGMRAETGKLEAATKVFQTMVNSTRPNLTWFNRYVQLCQMLIRVEMDRIKAAGDVSRIISQTNAEVSAMMQRTWEERNASQDRIHKKWTQYNRGVEEYYSPVERRAVELPSGYQNAWVNGRGEYLVTDRAGFDPNAERDGTWSRLERRP